MRPGAALVSLREITEINRARVEALRIKPHQQGYVGNVRESIVEAAETPDACPWYRGVYYGDIPVGFVMLSDGIPPGHPEYLGPYFLWRLLIDGAWQGRGFGTATLDLVVDYLRSRPGAETLLTSVQPGPATPLPFYLRYGFTPTGATFDGERVLELTLTARATRG